MKNLVVKWIVGVFYGSFLVIIEKPNSILSIQSTCTNKDTYETLQFTGTEFFDPYMFVQAQNELWCAEYKKNSYPQVEVSNDVEWGY